MRQRTFLAGVALLAAALIAALLLFLLGGKRGDTEGGPSQAVEETTARGSRAVPSRPAPDGPGSTDSLLPGPKAPPPRAPDDGRVPLRGRTFLLRPDGSKEPAPGALLMVIEGTVEIDAHTGGFKDSRPVRSGDDGAFETRVKPGVDLYLLPNPGDSRFTFPLGGQMQAVPPLDEAGGETQVRLIPRGRVSGVVIDAQGRPVEGATVSIAIDHMGSTYRDRSRCTSRAVSGTDGSFLLEGVSPGQGIAVVAVKAPWRRCRSETFPVEPGGEARDVTVQLLPGAWIRGKVQDPQGRPIPGAVVWATTGNTTRWSGRSIPWDVPEETASGEDGRYAIEGLEERTYRVLADREGCFRESLPEVSATPGGTEAPPLVLRSGEALSGIVVDQDGHPVVGAVVSAHDGEGAGAETRSNKEGRFELRPLNPGRNKVYAGSIGFLRWEPRDADVPVPDEFRIVLVRGMSIAGTVVDSGGNPVPGATVVADPEHPGGGPCAAAAGTDAKGRFSLVGLAPGPHVLETRAAGVTFPLLPSVEAGSETVEIRGDRR